jgi:hypothetical protein
MTEIWIDAQLSPALAAWVNRPYDDIHAQSVRAVGLRDADDGLRLIRGGNGSAVGSVPFRCPFRQSSPLCGSSVSRESSGVWSASDF